MEWYLYYVYILNHDIVIGYILWKTIHTYIHAIHESILIVSYYVAGDNPYKLSGDPKSVKGFWNLVSYRKVDKLMNVHVKQTIIMTFVEHLTYMLLKANSNIILWTEWNSWFEIIYEILQKLLSCMKEVKEK